MGSKSKIARWVVERLPEGDTLYDVFCGGCAITDYAMRMRKYGRYVINDITNIGYVFKKALDGGFRNETRWIDRKTYFENLEDPYVYLCFSFGNNPVCRYAYFIFDFSKHKMPIVRDAHSLVFHLIFSVAESSDICHILCDSRLVGIFLEGLISSYP